MRENAVAGAWSALALALAAALVGCGASENSGQTGTDPGERAIEWNGNAVRQLREAIDERASHGLDRTHFPVEGQPGTPGGTEALTASALRYAGALATGASDPAKLHSIYTLPRPDPPLRQGLAAALDKGKVREWLDSLAPGDDTYRKLSKAYLALRARGDGEAGSSTADSRQASALAVAMERMRWLDRNPPATRIDVNLATARLHYWRDGGIVDTRKVVVGEPQTVTPQLGSPIYRLVANPTWTVPRSIERKELAGRSSAYLRRNGMAWKDGWIVQQPGPQNSLGLVKFDMRNEHEIYLHDTPARQLFSEARRQRSHGCVRVEDALGFAERLARDEGVLDEWRTALASGEESFISLPRAITVRLYYQTVSFDAAGAAVAGADPYGWDDRVAAALGFPARQTAQLQSPASDFGP